MSNEQTPLAAVIAEAITALDDSSFLMDSAKSIFECLPGHGREGSNIVPSLAKGIASNKIAAAALSSAAEQVGEMEAENQDLHERLKGAGKLLETAEKACRIWIKKSKSQQEQIKFLQSQLDAPSPPTVPPGGSVSMKFEVSDKLDDELPGMRYCRLWIGDDEMTGWVDADKALDFKESLEAAGNAPPPGGLAEVEFEAVRNDLESQEYTVEVAGYFDSREKAEAVAARLNATFASASPALAKAAEAVAYWFIPSKGGGQAQGTLSCGHGGPVGAPCCRKCAQKMLTSALAKARGGE